MEGIPVEWRVWKGLSWFKGISGVGTYVDSPWTQRGFIHVPFDVRACRKCRASERPRSTTASILCQQNPNWHWDEVFALGEVCVSPRARYTEVAPLFSSSHRLCVDRISLIVTIEEIRFHGPNSQMGNPAWLLWYRPRSSVKGQVLADLVTEFSLRKEIEVICHVDCSPWKVFVDGASSAMGAWTKILIITLEGIRLEHSFRLGFRASNNEAEYKASLAGLRVVLDMGAQEVEVYLDSWLVVSQVQGSFEAWDSRMKDYLRVVRQVMSQFLKAKVV